MAVENPDVNGIVEKADQASKARKEKREKGEEEKEKKDKKDEKGEKVTIVIVLYKNGFVVDNEPFRSYDTPESKQFMKELNEGYVPKEISKNIKGRIGVSLDDRRDEEFIPPPPPKYVAYSGAGQLVSQM